MKKIISLLTAAIVLVGCLCVPALGVTVDAAKYHSFVCIGDSIAAGYGPYNYKYKGFKFIDGTYAKVVGDNAAVNTTQLARNGFRTEEVRAMLEDDYVGDSLLFQVSEPREDFPSLMGWYRDSIRGADLILVQLGSNDVLNYAYKSALEVMNSSAAFDSIRDLVNEDASNDIEEMIGQEIAAWQAVGTASTDALKAIDAFVRGLGDGLIAFKENWDIIIKDIRTLNPDARIVVLGNYNLIKTAKITDANLIPVGQMYDIVNNDMNRYIREVSPCHDQYQYVEIDDTETYELPALTDPNFGTLMVSFMHPTLEGHRYIANKVLTALGFHEVAPKSPKQAPLYLNCDDHHPYVSGYGDGTFRPGRRVTRAEAVSIIYSLLNENSLASNPKSSFSDIENHWAKDKINAVTSLGLVSGYPDGRFNPDGYITRAEFSAILSNFYPDQNSTGGDHFSDIKGHWAENYIQAAAEKELIAGYPDGSFRPNNALTRAQIVIIMNQVLLRNPDHLVMDKYDSNNPFTDVTKDAWYYYGILEASVGHIYSMNMDDEVWKTVG